MRRAFEAAAKRLFDLLTAAFLLLAISPLFALLALAVRVRIGSPILFRQTRPGLRGRPFDMLKFRSMTEERDSAGQLLPDARRLTTLGLFLRRTSLDELPELWCVLVGDMSVVGPRPLLMEYLALYSAEQARRHEVRPGITGWAQVNGRNTRSWEEKFTMDIWYVDNQSFLLDLRILALTARTLLRRDGISAPGDATMPRFTGSRGLATR